MSKKKQYIIIGGAILVGFVFIQSWANSVNKDIDKIIEKNDAKMADLELEKIKLFLKACGKKTFCSEDEITAWQSGQNLKFCGKSTDCSDDDVRTFMSKVCSGSVSCYDTKIAEHTKEWNMRFCGKTTECSEDETRAYLLRTSE